MHPDSKPGPAGAIDGLCSHHGWDENIGHRAGFRSDEAFRSDADDLEPVIAHAEGLPDNAGLASEPPRPIVIAQDCHRMRTGKIVVGRKQAAESRVQLENSKEVA